MNGTMRVSSTSVCISWQADVRGLFTPDALWEKLSNWTAPLSKDRIRTLKNSPFVQVAALENNWIQMMKSCYDRDYFQETNKK